jgi:hypothetical protein
MKLNQPAMPIKILDRKKWRLVTAIDIPVREYAAIHLCVPDSGNDELDAMIRRAQREKLAGQVLAHCGFTVKDEGLVEHEVPMLAEYCWEIADAVIAALKEE